MGKFKMILKAIKATVAQSFDMNTNNDSTIFDLVLIHLEKRAEAKRERERIAKDIQMIEEHNVKYAEWLQAQAEAEAAAAREKEEALLAEELERQERIRMYWDSRRMEEQMRSDDKTNKTDI
jgi:hypothetical protein